MDELNSIQVFITVVEEGSFSAAGRVLNKSTSAVARQVSWLEAELKARLINRTTRNQSLTEAGKLYYARVKEITRDLSRLRSETRSAHEEAEGFLRVSLRGSTATTVVVPALPELFRRYPGLELEIVVSDERLDLITNNIDIAIWNGELPDTEFVARMLSPSRRLVCGSPGYLARAGMPKVPSDLADHNCLLFKSRAYGREWSFTRNSETETVPVRGSIISENGLVLVSAAVQSIGLVVMPEWIVREQLQSGSLVQVMQDYDVSPTNFQSPLYAVFHSSRGLSRRVRVVVDYLAEIFHEKNSALATGIVAQEAKDLGQL